MAELSVPIIVKASGTASEEPLAADLEVSELAVNTADGKLFTKHTDGSIVTISGGGGAVDSVNGETGVVSLGIQDMNDFELASILVPSVLLDTKIVGTPDAEGEFTAPENDNTFVGNFFVIWGSGTASSQFSLLNTGDPLTFVYDDGSTSSTTFVTMAANGNGDNYVRVADNFPAAALVSASLLILNDDFTSENLHPAFSEGDVLQWDDSTQKFNQTQLPDAVATRTLLGIGEYVDDTAAGTGSVATGALYYNTTSSDYRLKT